MALLSPAPGRALLLAAGLALLAPRAGAQTLEYEVKAAFLYNFAKFVEWPADAFSGPGAPITYCVVGDDPFGARLETLLQGESVGGRRLALRRLGPEEDLGGCHILFLSRSERERAPAILARVRGLSVLTVGDGGDRKDREGDGFLARGGVINFRLQADRVRFDIDLAAAERARLKLSSKLLRVASDVR